MKKMTAFLICILLIFSATVTASANSLWQDGSAAITCDEAIAAYEAENNTKLATRRCYFQMPDGVHGFRDEDGNPEPSWFNTYSQGACVYWWGEVPAACQSWPGYRAMVADAEQHIYYADMPVAVESFIWNNGVDGGKDPTQPAYDKLRQTVTVFTEPADPGDYDTMPEGCANFDECIFIVKPEVPSTAVLLPNRPVDGSWYFYYGGGCYGMYDEQSANFKSVDENCCNPDHFDTNGRHIGYLPESVIRGDYDGDGGITVMDATRAQNIIAELTPRPAEKFLMQVDADGDKELTILDATRIQNVVADLMTMDGDYAKSSE